MAVSGALQKEFFMPVSLGARGQASFEEPLELLQDCHRRIEHFLGVLLRVVEESAEGVLDAPHREALQAALRELYRKHLEVEDREIFPLAGKALTAEELASVGREMKARRG
jgi:hemerythrin-like domain-containing protein